MHPLFTPTKIGTLPVKNHFVRSATAEGKATESGYPTPQVIETYRQLAKGNLGTIIGSYTYITNYEQPAKYQLGIYDDSFIEPYRTITNLVHQEGAKIIMQLAHGTSNMQGYPETARIISPSDHIHPQSGLQGKAASLEEIQSIIHAFGEAARRAKAAGFDGVQLHAAHGYLLSHWISPYFNHRTDAYGGSLGNRIRLLVEVYQEVRRVVGPTYPIWIKINSSDEIPSGFSQEDFLVTCAILSQLGIDAIEVSGGLWNEHASGEPPFYESAAKQLAALVNTPIILTGGVRTLTDMDRIANESSINLFGFSRPLITNPNFLDTL